MTEPLTLTFAELELVLALRPERSAVLRGTLEESTLDPDTTAWLIRAGLASLLARGLCETVDADASSASATLPDLRFGGEVGALLTALSQEYATTTAAAWGGTLGSVVHIVDSADVRVGLFPRRFGRYALELLDAQEPLSALLYRFLSRHIAEGSRSMLIATAAGDGGGLVSAVISVDESGHWFASDTFESPDHAVPVGRERALERIAELFDGRRGPGTADNVVATVGTVGGATVRSQGERR